MPDCDDPVNYDRICCPGGSGVFIFGARALGQGGPPGLNAVVYLVCLLWTFQGVAMAADIFMGAIEAVTSVKRTVKRKVDGKVRCVLICTLPSACMSQLKGWSAPCDRLYRVCVWNATVANLTLM